MFWRVPSYSQASPLEGILDKQRFTLEELLDEEDLIQVRQGNASEWLIVVNIFAQSRGITCSPQLCRCVLRILGCSTVTNNSSKTSHCAAWNAQ